MIDKLPYQLTEGVTATREGIVFQMEHVLYPWCKVFGRSTGMRGKSLLPWPDAAKRLRYRDGQPWCMVLEWETSDGGLVPMIVCGTETADGYALQRLAAILCDDAEAFRMLHWCVNNLGGEA